MLLRRRLLPTLMAMAATAISVSFAVPAHAGDVSAVRFTSTGLPKAQVASLNRMLTDAWGGLPGGATVGLWVPGKGSWVASVGVSDLRTGEPLHPQLQIPVGSVTKTLTGTLVLQEVQRGRLSLDVPISTWFPTFPQADKITVRMLLNMTSGIADYMNDNIAEITAAQRKDPRRHWQPDELISDAAAMPRVFETPGSAFSYSNSNTIILGRIVEILNGKPLTTLFRERLLQPLGMTRSQLNQTGKLQAPYAQTYSSIYGLIHGSPPIVRTTTWSGSPYWAAGGLASTLHDMRAWATALGTGEGVLSPAMQRERVTDCVVQTVTPKVTQNYCLGVAVYTDTETGEPVGVFHNGTVIGASSYVAYYPRTGAVLVVQSNQDSQTGPLSWTIPDKVSAGVFALAPELMGLG